MSKNKEEVKHRRDGDTTPTIERLDQIAISVRSHKLLKELLNENHELEEIMRMRDIRRTHEMHITSVVKDPEDLTPQLRIDQTPSDINDLSNVDIDREMSDMAKNHMQFVFSGNIARRFFELLNTSIRGV